MGVYGSSSTGIVAADEQPARRGMADYWKSNARYWCEYCNLSVADNVIVRLSPTVLLLLLLLLARRELFGLTCAGEQERSRHESSDRHKGNVQRKIRNLYKSAERDKKDKAKEAAEIARIERAAQAAVGGSAASTSAAAGAAAAGTKKGSSGFDKSNKWAHYTTAAQLGFEEATPSSTGQDGVPGEWQAVQRVPKPKKQRSDAGTGEDGAGEGGEGEGQAQDEEEEERQHVRMLTKGRTRALDDEDDAYDPSRIALKLKRPRLTLAEEEAQRDRERAAQEQERERAKVKSEDESRADIKPAAPGGWRSFEVTAEPMLDFPDAPSPPLDGADDGIVKQEGDGEDIKPTLADDVKPDVAKGGGMFKKRKMHGAGASRKK